MFELLTVPVRSVGGVLMAALHLASDPPHPGVALPLDLHEDHHSRTRDWSVRPSHLIPLREEDWNAGEACGTLRLYVSEQDLQEIGLKHRAAVKDEQRQAFDAVVARLTPSERDALRALKGEL